MNKKNIKEQFDLIARQYDEHRKCFIPCFNDYYVRSVSLLKEIKKNAMSITDLGAGTGLLTKEMYMLYPDAHFTLIDLSTDMLEVARQRFLGLNNFDYYVKDYSEGINKDSDIICSALSIHHLEDDEKQTLYQTIYKSLPHGGLFINLDQFCADSPLTDKAYNEWWMNYIDNSHITQKAKAEWLERKKLDRENSVSSTLSLLRNAGFEQVECVYKFMKFATVIAIKE